MWIITGAGAIGILYYTLVFFATRYFVTEKKIYKRTGIFWTKVISIKQEEIENMEANQPFLAGKFFNMGTLIFSTAGTSAFQIELKNVHDPFRRRKQIEAVWNMPHAL
ncbi:PH domain-containing protein [Candidatus Gracilibacteria bacterium]|nr:PH domain-containing protein [Candidatus Gracilibacteria bacterium]